MKVYDMNSIEFAVQTAVVDSLIHAVHPMHDDWRTKADALIEGLAARGYVIAPDGESRCVHLLCMMPAGHDGDHRWKA